MENKRRVLVVSNNCFSPSNSNGRTLGNLFYGWPKECLAQMCVIVKDPAWNVCDNYYCIEDRTMLSAFLHGQKAIGRQLVKKNSSSSHTATPVDTQRKNIGRKTLPKMMLRELVWAHKRWRSADFERWVNNFNPEVVVLQFGDSSFMIDIALYVAQSRKIPLVVYNTEGYYFFPRNWHYPSMFDAILFPLYRKYYKKQVCKLMSCARHSVYLNDKLQHDYDKEFGGNSSVIYNSSGLQGANPPRFITDVPRISYLGNLGLDRDSALTEVGEVLNSIDCCFHIDVYGNADADIVKRLNAAKGIAFHGSVSYDIVKEVIANSDILFHVESEKGYKERQLQYAFSGKIADSVSSGKCFVLYAPKNLACSEYIIKTGVGWYAETKADLKRVIVDIINDAQGRNKVLEKALIVAKQNHDFVGNAHKFQNILLSV